MTTTTTTPSVTVVCSRTLLITTVIMLAPTSVDQIPLGQHDVVLLPQMIIRDRMGGSVGLTTVM